jgi:hypothetical protein
MAQGPAIGNGGIAETPCAGAGRADPSCLTITVTRPKTPKLTRKHLPGSVLTWRAFLAWHFGPVTVILAVAAGIVEQVADWRWSSARSHINGQRSGDDPPTDLSALAGLMPNWRAMLRYGLDAGGLDAAGEVVAEAIEARLRTGRLLGSKEWIAEQERTLARRLTPAKRGPKKRERKG